jgi:hypothetical protein
MKDILLFIAVGWGALCLLFVYATCVVSGRISEDERQKDAAIRSQQEFEAEDATKNR